MALRPATDGDLPFLRDLYATTRAEEQAAASWPEPAWTLFLDSQFSLQHQHFVAHHPAGDFLIVRRRDEDVGRLYLDRGGATWRIVDIALLPDARNQGIGAALIGWLQRAAGDVPIDLHVARDNARAAALYRRLGFVERLDASASHQRMGWRRDDGVN